MSTTLLSHHGLKEKTSGAALGSFLCRDLPVVPPLAGSAAGGFLKMRVQAPLVCPLVTNPRHLSTSDYVL